MRSLASIAALLALGACRPPTEPRPEPDGGEPACTGSTFATYAPAPSASCGAQPGYTLELSAREPSVLRPRALRTGAFAADRSFAVVSRGTVALETTR